MFVDLDDFKDINHSYGYETGDKLLVAVAERLTQAFPSDTLGRLGGDEFTVLLENVSDINSAVAAADRLNKQLGAPFTLAEGEMLLSASVGITLSSGSDISTPESLLREANVAMQGAKKKDTLHGLRSGGGEHDRGASGTKIRDAPGYQGQGVPSLLPTASLARNRRNNRRWCAGSIPCTV